MKMRTGFVSNSSSSSFILGYGVIKNKLKLLSLLLDNKIDLGYDIKIHPKYKNFLQNEFMDEQILIGGNNTKIKIPNKLFNKGDLFIVQILNDEGDSLFLDYLDDLDFKDLDYSKADNIDFFSEQQQNLIKLFKNKEIITKGKVVFGAERNG